MWIYILCLHSRGDVHEELLRLGFCEQRSYKHRYTTLSPKICPFLDIHPDIELLDLTIILGLIFDNIPCYFPQWPDPCYISSSTQGSTFSTVSPTPISFGGGVPFTVTLTHTHTHTDILFISMEKFLVSVKLLNVERTWKQLSKTFQIFKSAHH